MVNNDNKSANWAEDFVCESAQCLKSNLALFGDNDNTNLYSILSRSNSNPMTKQGATNGFSSYLFQPEYGPNSEYPITLFIDKKSITPAVNDTEWHKKLIQLKGILEVSDQDVAKIQSTNEFLVNNYRDWDTNQFTNPYFGTFSTEKDFMTVNLNRVSDFRIASFIENSDYVWIFAEAVNTSTAKGLFFLFVFNRQANKFEMDGVEKGESRKIDRVLRHEFIAQNIFNEDSQGNKSKPDEPNKNMRIAETVNSLSVPFLIFIVVIILSVVGFVAF